MEIDDILGDDDNRKKRIKSGRKGKRVELELCKALNKRFTPLLKDHSDWGKFSRTVGSGNRWGQNVHLSKKAKETYSGDIVVPENFRFTIESKGGYDDIDLNSAFEGGHKKLDEFLQQAKDDAERCSREPMLVWKKDRKPRLVFVKAKELSCKKIDYSLHYRDWTAIPYEYLISLPDSFFFNY